MNRLVTALLILITAGCASTKPTPKPTGESAFLSNITQLTHDFDRAGEAYFSPDMKWTIFQAVPHGEKQYQMYVAPLKYQGPKGVVYATPLPMNSPLTGASITGIGQPIRITPASSRNTCGFFSPDNKSLIFASTTGKEDPTEATSGYQRQGGSYRWDFPKGMEIFRADNWREYIQVGDGIINLATHPLTNNDAYDAECAFSADGKWICFSSNRTGDLELYVMRSDGSDPIQLTHSKGYDGGPFFSPYGKRLVYRSDRQGNDLLQIFVADLVFDSSGKITGLTNERQLTDDGFVNWGPFWHPDGNHIIYASSAQGHQNYDLYMIRADGTHKLRVTHRDGFDGLPAFSPDGKYLMWSSKRSADGTTQVFIAKFHMPKDA